MMSFMNKTGVRVGGRVYRLRQCGLCCCLRPSSGRDTVCKEARGDRIYLLGLCRGRVRIRLIVLATITRTATYLIVKTLAVVTFWDYVVTVPKQ